MQSIGVKNLRSLKDVARIDLKPITVFVGRNSSGKSTMLRIFPLLKQTFETRTDEPILWYGKYVDFGDFEQSVTHKSGEEIFLSFELAIDRNIRREFYLAQFDLLEDMEPKTRKHKINISLGIKKKSISSINLNIDDQIIDAVLGEEQTLKKLTINGNEYSSQYLQFFRMNDLIPRAKLYSEKASSEVYYSYREDKKIYLMKDLMQKLENYASRKTSEETILKGIGNISMSSQREILKELKENTNFPQSMRNKLAELKIEDEAFKEINDLIVIRYFPNILDDIRRELHRTFINVQYSKPLRSTAERYYRIQGLAVDEVDPSGDNLAMVLQNLSEKEKQSFQAWTRKILNCEFYTEINAGHVSIYVQDNYTMTKDNLADTGFGYSQVLPILLSVWRSTVYRLPREQSRYELFDQEEYRFYGVIEQPELHLHPAFQAKLIDTFAKVVKGNKKRDIKFVLETHSETMINRLGYLIYKEFLPADMVNVVLFEKNSEGITKVTQTKFDEKGQLENWPVGFFSPERLDGKNQA